VGRTEITRATGLVLVILFLVTVSAGALGSLFGSESRGRVVASFGAFGDQTGAALGVEYEGGIRARNQALHRAIDTLEEDVEEASWMRRSIRPGVQSLLSRRLGVGNEQVYLGSDDWLFFRPSVDYLTGPSFLDPAVQARRALGGKAWTPAPHPDPLPAIEGWARSLAERGIQLMLVPTPVKPSIRPQGLAGPASGSPAVMRNPSFVEFVGRVRAAGVEVFDPAVELLAAEDSAGELYLRADTHWRPEAVQRVAVGLAVAIRGWAEREGIDIGSGGASYRRQTVTISNRGDLFDLLGLPAGQSLVVEEEVELARVVDARRRLWSADPEAPILLLGDSFSNVFSLPELGWGEGAGLAEQLSFELGAPIDKLAVNAGGAFGARVRLLEELAAGTDRLAGKRLVIWQFAERELAVGDWKPLPLP
jgi:alginate O-acetyltransferase complex protein AlgJ